jgi:DNA-binding MarR family transcriptional regulator
MLPMSSPDAARLGLADDEAERLGADTAVRIRTFRLIIVLAQQLRTLMDQRLRPDGLTTQQAALITVTDAMDAPALSQAALALGTTHQNIRQIADALERKGFLRVTPDDHDARIRRLHTTPRSRAYWQQRSASDQQHVLDWFSSLTEQEARTLFELLLRLQHRTHQPAGTRTTPTPPATTADPPVSATDPEAYRTPELDI